MPCQNHSQITKDVRALRIDIGKNIHNARIRKKVTLMTLSRQCGLSPERLDAFELGKYDIHFHHIVRIAKALKISPHCILTSC